MAQLTNKIIQGGEGKKQGTTLRTEAIVWSQDWIAPDGVETVAVRLFGGGGGALKARLSGGGGGHMSYNPSIAIKKNEIIKIIIGAGGAENGTGSPSSFGSYLSASGGNSGDLIFAGSGGSGGGGNVNSGGSGSYGGGGGGGANSPSGNATAGGTGGTFGGGGGRGSQYNGASASAGSNGRADMSSELPNARIAGFGGGIIAPSGSGGGGGGSCGGNGGSGSKFTGGGGAGYGSDGGAGGGGGGYGINGHGADLTHLPGFAAGGNINFVFGGNGICIISYYV